MLLFICFFSHFSHPNISKPSTRVRGTLRFPHLSQICPCDLKHHPLPSEPLTIFPAYRRPPGSAHRLRPRPCARRRPQPAFASFAWAWSWSEVLGQDFGPLASQPSKRTPRSFFEAPHLDSASNMAMPKCVFGSLVSGPWDLSGNF